MNRGRPVPRRAPARPDLDHVETWIFDLDNTLYPASSNLFDQVSANIGTYIQRHFGLDAEAARALQKRLFREHRTTLNGLMVEHGVDPADYLAHVHEIDVSVVPENPALRPAIDALPGAKIIFTNGSVRHAERVLERLGLAGAFDAIEDIVSSRYVPKPEPEPYRTLVARHGVDPRRAVMVEDMAVNLMPAHDLGMTTVWVRTDHPHAAADADAAHVHHVVDDVADWLMGLQWERETAGED
ncbi:MAG: pyrimidine 5'-nucleotidase [Azospirillaceae bacterium]